MRYRAMETLSGTRTRAAEQEDAKREKGRRRSGGETFEWLKEKVKVDKKMKEREWKEKKEERERSIQ